MLRWVVFDTAMFAPGDDDARARKDLMWLLEALSQRNQTYLAEHPETPKLYTSGVTYAVPQQMDRYSTPEIATLKKALGSKLNDAQVSEAFENIVDILSGERFRDIPRVLDAKAVDCDNLSAFRVAELRQAGIKAMPYVTHRARLDGGTTMHALVRWPDGTDEDPSRILGMGGDAPDAVKEREEEIRKNDERRDKTAKKIDDLLRTGLLTKREAKNQLVLLGAILPPLRANYVKVEGKLVHKATLKDEG